MVSLDDDSSTHTSCEPKQNNPPSPKPDAPPSPHIPSPPSPIPCIPPPTTTPNSPSLGFIDFANPSVSVDPILAKLQVLQSQFHSFQDEVRVIFVSLSDQLTQMETHLSAKLNIVEVQTEYVNEDEPVV